MVFDKKLTGISLMWNVQDGKEVTRNLQITYYRPVPVAESVIIETEIVSVGKRLATVRGLMKKESDGVLLASCTHEKYYPGGERL